MLEAAQHDANSFVTLTYGDTDLPSDNSLRPRDLTLFIKRLRKRYGAGIRYFACGEYGETTGRPHYHLALFGFPHCERGNTDHHRSICCPVCSQISESWGMGRTDVGTLTPQSAQYVAGYIAKKYTAPQALNGRTAQFARMSLRPGIGIGMMHELASTMLQHRLDERMIDVPDTLQHGLKKWPLGRYLRRKLRTFIGRDPNAPQAVLQQLSDDLQTMRETAWANKTSLKTEVLNESLGRRIQIEAKHKGTKREKA